MDILLKADAMGLARGRFGSRADYNPSTLHTEPPCHPRLYTFSSADVFFQDNVDKIRDNLQRSINTQKLFAAIESRDRRIIESNFETVNFWSAVQLVAMVTAAAVNVIVIRGLFNDRRSSPSAAKLRT